MDEHKSNLVVDFGSGVVKAGFSGEDEPSVVFPNIMGVPRQGWMGMAAEKEFYYGDEALSKRGILTLKYPTEDDIVKKMWRHMLNDKLCIKPEEHAVLWINSGVLSSRKSLKNSEKLAEMMFEDFGAPAMQICDQSSLALFSSGRTTGIVVNIGHTICQMVPVNVYALPQAESHLNVAGKDLTEYLTRLLYTQSGHYFSTSAEKEIVREIKEKLAHVSEDYEYELSKAKSSLDPEKFYELPDGRLISINSELFGCAEILFNPYSIGCEGGGIHTLTNQSIMKCEENIRNDLYRNIVLTGGTTMLPGIVERFTKEMKNLTSRIIKIISSPCRKYEAWIGGSIMASLSVFQETFITMDEYKEAGPHILYKKYSLC